MGAEARVSRRRVLTAAKDAVDKTNDLVERYNAVVVAQNALVDKVESNDNARKVVHGELAGRIDAQGKWLAQLDAKAGAIDARVDTTRRHADTAHTRISEVRAMLPDDQTFLGRLRWLLWGG